jgi:sulfite reductase (NADPH) flavoprotein alpha-component
MRQNSRELFAWLEKGAYFYVCGDASRMATDVDVALHAIIQKEGAMSEEDAAAYVKKLKEAKRYLRDVY